MKTAYKLIFKIFSFLLIVETLFGLIAASFGGVISTNKILGFISMFFNFLVRLSTLPLSLIDKSYPYYAMVSIPTTIGLVVLNVSLQTLAIWFVFFRNKQ